MDLLREQVKILAGEVALCTSSLKILSEQAASKPEDSQLQEQKQKLKDEIKKKKLQIRVLEQQMAGSVEMTQRTSNNIATSQALSKLATQLNEKTFDLEIKSADNRILQEQLQLKISENAEMQETVLLLRRQLDSLLSEKTYSCPQHPADIGRQKTCAEESSDKRYEGKDGSHAYEETCIDESTPTSVMSLNRIFSQEQSKEFNSNISMHSKLLMQEASYAKELAADAAVELRNLDEEVTKLTYQNAKLTAELVSANEASCRSNCCQRPASFDMKKNRGGNGACLRKYGDSVLVEELQQELNTRYQIYSSLVTALSEREKIENELRKDLMKQSDMKRTWKMN
ncbi:Kinesin-like protein [Actinidia chinensis var. chinensis]|uniref:Kinesin-like protein n=1 Tax=Actinidia chinensis var. chinensis TaxID=1590841 RepID=A0A2R6RPH2_ACTCC|nr:Kinesin-like protein [Actinidia chinensis var. chinensis]